jgi:hypothetical protein
MTPDALGTVERGAQLYLELLKGCLTRQLFPDHAVVQKEGALQRLGSRLPGARRRARQVAYDAAARAVGKDRPTNAETMIGRARLDHLEQCVVDVVQRGIPGDLIETGVWRGGATILMRAVLAALGDTEKTVWVADSFQGLPPPDPERYPEDTGADRWTLPLGVSVEQVKENFARYGLLDDQVAFLEGWFSETLPGAPIQALSLLRLDGDMYESTMDALRHLYPLLSPGGYLIVDDYGVVPACKAAVEDYRSEHGITEPVEQIDWSGVYWKRGST